MEYNQIHFAFSGLKSMQNKDSSKKEMKIVCPILKTRKWRKKERKGAQFLLLRCLCSVLLCS
jgi:hypothetical protein